MLLKYAKLLGDKQGVLWECESSELPTGVKICPQKQSHSGIRHFGCSPFKHFAENLVGN